MYYFSLQGKMPIALALYLYAEFILYGYHITYLLEKMPLV